MIIRPAKFKVNKRAKTMATTTAAPGSTEDTEDGQDPIVILGIVLIVIAVVVIFIFLFGAISNCFKKRMRERKESSGLEIKSSAKRHGPGAFVKDADFSYINIESRSTDRKKKKRELERYRSLERYNSITVDNVNIVSNHTATQTGSSISNDEGPVIVSESSESSGSRDNTRGFTPPKRLNNQLYRPKTTNIDLSPKSNVSNDNVTAGNDEHTVAEVQHSNRSESTDSDNTSSQQAEDSRLEDDNTPQPEHERTTSTSTTDNDSSRERISPNKAVLFKGTPLKNTQQGQGHFQASIFTPSDHNNLRLQLLDKQKHNPSFAEPTSQQKSTHNENRVDLRNQPRVSAEPSIELRSQSRESTDPRLESRNQPRVDLKASGGREPEVGGSRTVIYVVGDNYDFHQKEKVVLRPTSISADNLHKRPQFIGDGMMSGYIENLDGAKFEDPRMYSSYL